MYDLPTILEQGLMPDIIDQTDANDIFLGYLKHNGATFPANYMIKRVSIETSPTGKTVIMNRFPNGKTDFTNAWDNRYSLEYRQKNTVSMEGMGSLYSPLAANDARLIASPGFRLPSNTEFDALIASVGANNSHKLMRVLPFPHWITDGETITPTNEFNFSAMGSGYVIAITNNDFVPFQPIGRTHAIWGSDIVAGPFGTFCSSLYLTRSENNLIKKISKEMYMFLSVRLVKEDSIDPGYYVGNDKQVYKTSKIGDVVWTMPINETMYRNGDPITFMKSMELKNQGDNILSINARTILY